MKIFLHIGTHKTGSTALQSFLHNNRQQLLSKGVYYAETANDLTGHQSIAWMIRDGEIAQAKDFILQQLSKAQEHNCDSLVLSSEEFEFTHDVKRVASVLPLPTEIILFLRRQDDYLESEYGQHLRMYNIRFTGDIYQFYMYHNLFNRFNYQFIANRWQKHFPKESFHIVNYDEAKKHNIFDTFFKIICTDRNHLITVGETYKNVGLSAQAYVYLARLNEMSLSYDQHHRGLSILKSYFPNKDTSLLSKTLRNRLLHIFSYQNHSLAKTYWGIDNPFSAQMAAIDTRKEIHFYNDFDPKVLKRIVSQI